MLKQVINQTNNIITNTSNLLYSIVYINFLIKNTITIINCIYSHTDMNASTFNFVFIYLYNMLINNLALLYTLYWLYID